MEPLGFWGKVWFVLMAPWRWIQCCAQLPIGHGSSAYCVRNKGHFGKHRAYNGEEFV
jgi:hypothetical protein